jgi:isomerase DpgB
LTIDSSAELSASLVQSVADTCARVEEADGKTVVVLRTTGAGEGAWPGAVGIHLVSKWEQALRRLERAPAAIIAVAEHRLTGPALEASLIADYRIGTADLAVGMPARDGSLWPGMALHRLAQQLGVARTRQLALLGVTVSAEDALRIGLIDEIAADGTDLAETVARTLKLVSGLAGSELAMRRRLLLDAVTTSFEESLGAHLSACDRTLGRAARPDEAETIR